jgi:hypothetical protein
MCNHNTGTVYLSGIASAATANDCPKFASNGYDLADSGAGCGGLSGLTTNVLLKATSSTSAGNSSITDNTSTVTTPEPGQFGTGITAVYTTQGANQNVEIGSGNGSGSDGGTGTVTAYNFVVDGGTFSTLASCSSGLEGSLKHVTDSTTNTWGGTISGSGSDHVLAYCDGTNWTVAGK